MLVLCHLDGGVGRVRHNLAGRELHPGIDIVRRERYLGQALGGEFGFIDDDFLDGWV